MDRIELRNIQVECIIGVLPPERIHKQEINVAITVSLDTTKVAHSCDLTDTIDYTSIYRETKFILGSAQFNLLETAAAALTQYVLTMHASLVAEVTVRIEKPQALPSPAIPVITITKLGKNFSLISQQTDFGTVDVVQETSNCGIYLLRIAPRGRIATHYHLQTEEYEMVLSSGLQLQGKPVEPGFAVQWPLKFPHRYDNPTASTQTILCINRPAFRNTDEIYCDIPMKKLQNVPSRYLV